MLKQHQFYVYHEGSIVYARMENRDPVIIETSASPQAAADKVQSIVNPQGRKAVDYGDEGFLSKTFQEQVSANCEKAVREAYGKGGRP